jgi:hypothetical protein
MSDRSIQIALLPARLAGSKVWQPETISTKVLLVPPPDLPPSAASRGEERCVVEAFWLPNVSPARQACGSRKTKLSIPKWINANSVTTQAKFESPKSTDGQSPTTSMFTGPEPRTYPFQNARKSGSRRVDWSLSSLGRCLFSLFAAWFPGGATI